MLSHKLRRYKAPALSNTDPNFKQVSLLLHGDGTNGAQNNTFIGEVNPAQYYGTFNGSTQYLTAPSSTAFSVGTGDFTVEAWIYYINSASYNYIFQIGASSAQSIHIRFPDGGFGEKIQCGIKDNSVSTEWSCALTKTDFNQKWMHVAFTRSSGVCRFFVNGQLQNINNGANPTTYPYTSFTDTTSITDTQLTVGASYGGANKFKGNISNIRYLKGTALYTANFTPPNGTLLAVTGTQLLTLQNSTIVDNSTNNFTITNNGSVAMTDQYPTVTRNGNTTQGTNTPFSQAAGYWSNYFDGTADYLTAPASSAYNLSAGDWTIEYWIYKTSDKLCTHISQAAANWRLQGNENGTITVNLNSTDRITSSAVSINAWNHVALVRNSTTITLYINGVSNGTTTNTAANADTSILYVGVNPDALGSWNYAGYISNARVVKGTAVYTANFTPPTAPLTAITNTSLLTCQSNNFKDNSSNNFAITRNGDTSVQPFSPFAPTAAYSTSVNGGSMYFDGTGDFLSVPDNANIELPTQDFTIECFVYLNSFPTGANIATACQKGVTGTSTFEYQLSIFSSAGQIRAAYSTDGATVSTITTSGSIALNSWNHIAVTRIGTSATVWINGVSSATGTWATTGFTGSATLTTGANSSGANAINGYISNFRILKGTALYTTTFTPPTAPLTAITNTQLLLNGTNAGIFDNAIKNDLETVGNAQVSTAVTKFGTGSMKFDSGGGGGYLIIPTSNNFTFGTGNFTIEFWVYSNSTQSALFYDSRPLSTNGIYPTLYTNADNTVRLFVNSVDVITSSAVLTNNTWHHVAVCRSGTATKLFINGTQSGSTYTDTNNYLNGANRPVIGTQGVTLGASVLNGYIDDLRVTNGIARYTANFTPPTAAFPNQ